MYIPKSNHHRIASYAWQKVSPSLTLIMMEFWRIYNTSLKSIEHTRLINKWVSGLWKIEMKTWWWSGRKPNDEEADWQKWHYQRRRERDGDSHPINVDSSEVVKLITSFSSTNRLTQILVAERRVNASSFPSGPSSTASARPTKLLILWQKLVACNRRFLLIM